MSEIPFYLIITKPNKHRIEIKIMNEKATDINEVKNRIIYLLQEELSTIYNLPYEYENLIGIWYSTIAADSEPFHYKLFNNNEWSSPWSIEELYDEAYEILHKLELISGYINEENGLVEEGQEDADESVRESHEETTEESVVM